MGDPKEIRLIEFFKAQWADAGKSGEWMADAPGFERLSRWQRWNIRTLPRSQGLLGLFLVAFPVLLGIFLLVVVIIFLVVQLIDALT